MFKALPGVLAIVALTSACHLTEYPIITDEDQTTKVTGTHAVNTTGDAFIAQKAQVAKVDPDGNTYENVWFMNQANDPSKRTIYNYTNVGHLSNPSSIFHGSVYMNPDHTGCWSSRAHAGGPLFDFDANVNCQQFNQPAILLAKFTRNQEAGRDGNHGSDDANTASSSRAHAAYGVTFDQAVDMLVSLRGAATYGEWTDVGMTGYRAAVTPANATFELATDAGVRTAIVVDGTQITLDPVNNHVLVDLRTGNVDAVLNQLADWVDANGRSATLYATVLGQTLNFSVGLNTAQQYRDWTNKY